MARLTGGTQAIDLGRGISIRAPGLRGSAERIGPRAPGTRGPEEATSALDEAFSLANVSELETVEVGAQATAAAPEVGALRSPSGDDALELEVPDLGDEVGQVVLLVEETGALSWHFPQGVERRAQRPGTRGTGGTRLFVIPRRVVPPAAGTNTSERSLVRAIGTKLLKVLIYPVTDPLFGLVGPGLARAWEAKRRPYGLRRFDPGNYRDKDGPALTGDDWTRLAEGRALLFIHGTFSTAHGAFGGIPPEVMSALDAKYKGRVFAFNHYTLSDDPADNVGWLLQQVPPSATLDMDIICHSRGGLVSRTLAERPPALQVPDSPISVKRIVHVGVPNRGTLLADPRHMVDMLDRVTTVINLAFSGPAAELLDGVLTVVKVVGHGALASLRGLAAMNPAGPFLNALNVSDGISGEYYAVAADFEPVDLGLKHLVRAAGDLVLDRVFEEAPNDLVVPEQGVYSANGSSHFPIAPGRLLRIPAGAGVSHVDMFRHAPTTQAFLDWL
jgi:hypothetical protein